MEPTADRPFMPGYGIEPEPAAGLLHWSWAIERLTQSHDFWLATVRPDALPHVMPVWGVLIDEQLWCSTGPESRKAANLRSNKNVTITTDNPAEPVIVEGVATIVNDDTSIQRFAAAMDAKYDTNEGSEFYAANLTIRVEPRRVFGIDTATFTTSPTRWRMNS